MTGQSTDSEPFADVIAIGSSYFHGDVISEQALDDLRYFANLDPMPDWVHDFKTQTTRALEHHLDGMNIDEFDRKVEHGSETTEIFIRRMWATIFPDEPIPGSPNGPWDTTYTLLDIYLRDREPEDNHVHPDHLRRQLQRPDEEQTPLLRSIKPELTRMLHGDFDGLDLKEFRTLASSYYFSLHRDYKDFARHAWGYLFPDEPSPET